ncbi:hypothetical protein JT55_17180 [Rhodovulum sp. NI22]|uniref:hypothetical protein n=1 Tax=Actibacterium sp. TaxID=1872125 RepID=UPI00050FE168|nr:hypothetical protein [Actibacterium sp.]KGB80731.1 hypothetical protein JT55_17180 [Rhodovulum sp. NI22]
MNTFTKLILGLSLASFLPGCEADDNRPRHRSVVALKPATVMIDNQSYVVRRSRVTYVDGDGGEVWAIVIGGRPYTCAAPTPAGCRETLRYRQSRGPGPAPPEQTPRNHSGAAIEACCFAPGDRLGSAPM